MLNSLAAPDGTHRHRVIVVAGIFVLIVAALGSYALLAGRDQSARSASIDARGAASVELVIREPSRPISLASVAATADPKAFARSVAGALFEWDTGSTITTTALTERLMAVGDPSGESATGLVADLANYLPTADAWAVLRLYQTRQWIEITSVEVPRLWATAVKQAGPGGLLPGTAAYTVRGVRHRSGVWEGAAVHSAHDVAFTVFVVCGPAYPECHLLRLSRLDQPLD